jgi:hypothetical protein
MVNGSEVVELRVPGKNLVGLPGTVYAQYRRSSAGGAYGPAATAKNDATQALTARQPHRANGALKRLAASTIP